MMKKRYERSRNAGLSLIQVNDNREAMLMKMRAKLAGASDFHVQATETRKLAVRKSTFAWGWKIGIAAILTLCNIAYFSSDGENILHVRAKRAAKLPHPSAALSVNDQALYWAYALYDFDMLKSKYRVSKTTIVNASMANERLRELLPRVDAATRFAIERYTSQAGGIK